MIQTEGLSREYGDKVALSDLNLRVEPGEILGFLGPNGSADAVARIRRLTRFGRNQIQAAAISRSFSTV